MEISAAVLPFLILAAALGSPIHGAPADRYQPRELRLAVRGRGHSMILHSGVHRPRDCCSKTTRKIQCGNMEDYYETSSGCSQSAVIFKTKRGNCVCANLHSERVQDCMKKLNSAKKQRKIVG